MATEVTFTLEYLSLASLTQLRRAAENEQIDYATAPELTQEQHDEINARLAAIRREIATRPAEPARNLLLAAAKETNIDTGVRMIQDALGIETGDVAGQSLAGKDSAWKEAPVWSRLALIAAWLKAECFYAGREG
jgi:hypothetical protein